MQWLWGPGGDGCSPEDDGNDRAVSQGPGYNPVLEQTISPLCCVSHASEKYGQ